MNDPVTAEEKPEKEGRVVAIDPRVIGGSRNRSLGIALGLM
jgi:hypothetical protein